MADPDSVCWIDLDDQQALNTTIASRLNDPLKRSDIAEGYELGECLQSWSHLVNRLLDERSSTAGIDKKQTFNE